MCVFPNKPTHTGLRVPQHSQTSVSQARLQLFFIHFLPPGSKNQRERRFTCGLNVCPVSQDKPSTFRKTMGLAWTGTGFNSPAAEGHQPAVKTDLSWRITNPLTHMHTHAHTGTHAHMQTHTCTHTHTHAQAPAIPPSS